MKHGFVLFLMLLLASTLKAQLGSPDFAGARFNALGNASVALEGGNGIFSNQAGLSALTDLYLTLNSENRFLIAGLNTFSLGAAYPTGSGTLAVGLQYFGNRDYNEQKFGLAYARQLFDRLSIGAQLDFFSVRIAEYGSEGTFSFELGFRSEILKGLALGAHVYSPIRVQLSEQHRLPTVLRIGLAYQTSSKVLITTELEDADNFPLRFKGGIEYLLAKAVYIRVGASTHPDLISFGVGYKFSQFSLDVASSYHQVLGLTPAASLNFEVAKPSE